MPTVRGSLANDSSIEGLLPHALATAPGQKPVKTEPIEKFEKSMLKSFRPLYKDSNRPAPLPTFKLEVKKPIPYHIDCHKNMAKYRFWECSYKCGADYRTATDAAGKPIFSKHAFESPEQADRRREYTAPRNFCAPVVQKYNNTIFTSTIKRSDDPKFQNWSENVDLYGKCLHEFIRDVFEKSQVNGQFYILIDSTNNGIMATQAQKSDQLYLMKLHPNSIINWQYQDGCLMRAIVDFPDAKQCVYYDHSNFQRATYNDKQEITELGPVLSHNYPTIPIIRVICDDDANSQIASTAEGQKQYYNLSTLLMEEHHRVSFPQIILTGASLSDLQEASGVKSEKGSFDLRTTTNQTVQDMRILCIPGSGITMEKPSSDPTQAGQIRESLDNLAKQIYEESGLSNLWHKDTGNIESAKTHIIKNEYFYQQCRAMADHACLIENSILQIWSLVNRIEIEPTQYMDDFTSDDISTEITDTLRLVESEKIPASIKGELLKQLTPKIIPHINPEIKEELEEAIDEAFLSEEDKKLASEIADQDGEPTDTDELAHVVIFNKKDEVLLASHKEANSGPWRLPGGHIQEGEDPLTAARRELFEETGLLPVELIHISDNPPDHYFAAISDLPVKAGSDDKSLKFVSYATLSGDITPDFAAIMAAHDRLFRTGKPAADYSLVVDQIRNRPMAHGLLIVFEGPDAAGKSSQATKLYDWLKGLGKQVLYSKWNSSELLHKAIKEFKTSDTLDPLTYSLLHSTDMRFRYTTDILPALEKNQIVVCDRYIYTSYVRDTIRGVPKEMLDTIYKSFITPDILFYCRVDEQTAVDRLKKNGDITFYGSGFDIGLADTKEESQHQYHTLMIDAYDKLMRQNNAIILDSTNGIEILAQQVREIVGKSLQDPEIPDKEYQKMFETEQKEHPSMNDEMIHQIVIDHFRLHKKK